MVHNKLLDPKWLSRASTIDISNYVSLKGDWVLNDVNYAEESPLIIICKYLSNDYLHVKRLLTLGANPNAVENTGRTPLMLSLEYGDEKMIDVLLEHGASFHSLPPNITEISSLFKYNEKLSEQFKESLMIRLIFK